MNILNIISKIKSISTIAVLGLLVSTLGSCNKDFAFKLDFDKEPEQGSVKSTEYKVAYIVLEGGVGSIVAKEATDYGRMPTLAALSTTAMVSWNGVSAENGEALTSYADLLTGVEYDKHKVAGSGANNELLLYPTLFKRIDEKSSMRKSFVSANIALGSLVKESDVNDYEVLASDEEVTEHTVKILQEDNAGIVVSTFKNVDQAGQLSGYDSEGYKASLATFDGQLKRIKEAIYARKNYANERWLIIVASTKGGVYALPPHEDDGSIFAKPERNNFVVISNPNFAFKFYERMQTVDPEWSIAAPRFTDASEQANRGKGTLAADKAKIYNMLADKDYTVQVKVKILQPGKQNPPIISNRSSSNGSEAGWTINFSRNGDDNGNVSTGGFIARYNGTTVPSSVKTLEVDTWHTVTYRIWREGSQKKATLYVNGIPSDPVNISGAASTGLPLVIGNPVGYIEALNGKRLSYMLADIRFYDAAWKDEDIKRFYCSTMSTSSTDPYRERLVGYWPGTGTADQLRDQSGNNCHFNLTGTYTWINFSEKGPTLCPTLPDHLERYVVRSVDIPRMIYNWFNFTNIESYNLDSQVWNPTFTNP